MNLSKLEKKAEEIVKAYKGFRILKNGSVNDKFFFICFIVFFIIAAIALFVISVFFDGNLVLWLISFTIYIAFVILFCLYQKYILKRETKVYIKGANKQENFLNYFEQELEKLGIHRSDYNIYINYFNNKLEFEQTYKTNEVSIYLTTILCPIFINFLTDNGKTKMFIPLLGILGIFIIPGLLFSINFIIHRKEFLYKGIIYYLNLGLLSE